MDTELILDVLDVNMRGTKDKKFTRAQKDFLSNLEARLISGEEATMDDRNIFQKLKSMVVVVGEEEEDDEELAPAPTRPPPPKKIGQVKRIRKVAVVEDEDDDDGEAEGEGEKKEKKEAEISLELPKSVRTKQNIIQFSEANIADDKKKVADCMCRQWIWLCKGLMLWDPLFEYTAALGPNQDGVGNLVALLLRNAQRESGQDAKDTLVYFESTNSICKILLGRCDPEALRRLFKVSTSRDLKFVLNPALDQLKGKVILNNFLSPFEKHCFEVGKITKKAPSRKSPFYTRIPQLIQSLSTDAYLLERYNSNVRLVQGWTNDANLSDCLFRLDETPMELFGDNDEGSPMFLSDVSIEDVDDDYQGIGFSGVTGITNVMQRSKSQENLFQGLGDDDWPEFVGGFQEVADDFPDL
jgi:hypothetical protein